MKPLLLLLLIMPLSLGLWAQTALLDQRITITVRQATIEETLQLLQKACSCSFSYGPDLLPLKKKVSVVAQGQKLGNILQDLIGSDFAYKQIGDQLVIYRTKSVPFPKKFTLNGYVKDALTGELLIGASVYIHTLSVGMATNSYGFYSLTLPAGNYQLQCSYMGYVSHVQVLEMDKDVRLDISLAKETKQLQEVTVTVPPQEAGVQSLPISSYTLSGQNIKSLPALAGETDVIKAIQLLPGVKTLGEGSSGFFVRGGGLDQNLILLDEAPVYNPSHLLGFFSTFNADAIKDVRLYTGGIPAQFGGRLSSLLDIRMRDGNAYQWKASGGIGLISSRLTIEGPVKKDKSSVIISMRRSYADLFLPLLNNPDISDTRLYFYDVNAKFNYTINPRNRLFLSGYVGRDLFKEKEEFNIGWGNKTGTLRWNHLFSEKLFSNFTLLYSKFNYQLGIESDDQNTSTWTSSIQDVNLKTDFTFFLNPRNTIRFGWNSIFHTYHPGSIGQEGESNVHVQKGIPKSYALEQALYISDELKLNNLQVDYGLRYSLLQNLGKATVYNYNQAYQLTDSIGYSSGNIYHTSGGFEPRVNVQWALSECDVVKASYSRMRQYVQLISNYATSFSAPDIWLPSGPAIKPQIADQMAVGYQRGIYLRGQRYEFSLEAYYKHMTNQLDYKDHAQLALNPHLEGELRRGKAWSYGVEYLLSKKWGKLSGYISYTWSRTLRKTPEVNAGKSYPARYDKPHAVTLVGNYQLSSRWNLAANWVYTTGEAVTLPTGSFEYRGKQIPIYSDRNAQRLPAYHRLDISATLQPKPKPGRKLAGSWTFALYNAYYRKNTFAIHYNRQVDAFGNIVSMPFSTQEPLFETRKATTKTYLFSIIPSVTYNFTF